MSWCCSCVLFVSPYYSASFIGEELADTELSAWSLHTHGLFENLCKCLWSLLLGDRVRADKNGCHCKVQHEHVCVFSASKTLHQRYIGKQRTAPV